jgi:hypothetical protein
VAETSGLVPDTPELLPLTSLPQLLKWYRLNLCEPEIRDCRGYRIRFLDTDFVHLIKLIDKYGKEPKNRRMTIEQIESGRIQLVRGRFDVRRTQELSWARSILQNPMMIVVNWQVMGRANPGEAYIKNFGTDQNPAYRVVVCGFAGQQRRPVTIFPRERFAAREIHPILWP